MQQTLDRSWWVRARMPGALRYHALTTGRLLGFVLLTSLAASLLGVLLPLVSSESQLSFAGVAVDYGLWGIIAAVVCCQVAGNRTRFLLRFGSGRFAVWLSNIIALFVGLVLFALGTMLISLLIGLLMAALAQSGQSGYRFYQSFLMEGEPLTASVWRTFTAGLGNLPESLWGMSIVISVLHLLGCCLRKNKPATLCVIIGLPLVLFTLMLVPAVREAVDMASRSQGDAMLVAAQWYTALLELISFLDRNIHWIMTAVGVACLPLSYWVMRCTKQP